MICYPFSGRPVLAGEQHICYHLNSDVIYSDFKQKTRFLMTVVSLIQH